MKIKTRTYGDKFYTKVRGLNVPEDDECQWLLTCVQEQILRKSIFRQLCL